MRPLWRLEELLGAEEVADTIREIMGDTIAEARTAYEKGKFDPARIGSAVFYALQAAQENLDDAADKVERPSRQPCPDDVYDSRRQAEVDRAA